MNNMAMGTGIGVGSGGAIGAALGVIMKKKDKNK